MGSTRTWSHSSVLPQVPGSPLPTSRRLFRRWLRPRKPWPWAVPHPPSLGWARECGTTSRPLAYLGIGWTGQAGNVARFGEKQREIFHNSMGQKIVKYYESIHSEIDGVSRHILAHYCSTMNEYPQFPAILRDMLGPRVAHNHVTLLDLNYETHEPSTKSLPSQTVFSPIFLRGPQNRSNAKQGRQVERGNYLTVRNGIGNLII